MPDIMQCGILITLIACSLIGHSSAYPLSYPTPTTDPAIIEAEYRAHEDAFSQYHELTGQKEEEITRLMLNGMLLSDSGRHSEAINYFSRVLEIEPACADAWYYSAMSQYKLNQTGAAMEAFSKTLQTDPDYYYAWYGISLVYHKQGEIWKQSEAISKALEIEERISQKPKGENQNPRVPDETPQTPLSILSVIFGCLIATPLNSAFNSLHLKSSQ